MTGFIHFALAKLWGSLHDPAWIAAYALAAQVGIFFWQSRILKRHAVTMEQQKDISKEQKGILEEQKDISKKQCETAELIGKAVGQQSNILSAQFRFQRLLEAQSERKTVFDLVIPVMKGVYTLQAYLETVQYSSKQEIDQVRAAYTSMHNAVIACKAALMSCEHLSVVEQSHIRHYLDGAASLQQTNAANRADYIQLTNFNDLHKDFLSIMAKNREEAVKAITSGI